MVRVYKSQSLVENFSCLAETAVAPEDPGQLVPEIDTGFSHSRAGPLLVDDLQGAAVGRDRLVDGEMGSGVPGGNFQMVHGPLRFPGHGVVVAQHRRHLLEAVGRGCLQAPGRPGMERSTLAIEQAAIGRLLDKGVPESVDGLGQLTDLAEQARARTAHPPPPMTLRSFR